MTDRVAADRIALWRQKPDVMVRELFHVTPDPWQDEVLKAFPSKQRIAMKASKGPGKVQPKSLIVDTPDGPTKWGDLYPGDRVFAEDGSITNITARHENGVVQLYRVYFDDGSSTLVGGEHWWKVRGQAERLRKYAEPYKRNTRTDKEVWSVLTTNEIIERGVRVKNGKHSGRQFEIPIHGPVQFSDLKCQPIDPYVLGIWLGDGSKNSGSYTGIDDDVKTEIVSRGYELGSEIQNKVRTIRGIRKYLRALGVLELGSHERYIPYVYKYATIQQRKDVLSGLLDTDGCIDKHDGHIEFDSTSKQLAEDVVWLVRSLGGNARIKDTIKKPFYYSANREKIFGRDCYRVSIKLLFNPFKISRKAVRWSEPKNNSQLRYIKRYIDRIEVAHEEDAMCISIDHPSRCYLTNDFIVTHNSCLESWLMWNFLLTRPHPKIAATSISGDNLRDGLWSEMAKWRNESPLLQNMFTWQKERIFAKEFPETWWASARMWSKAADPNTLGNTLAGLHADYIMFILDESGGLPDAIMASAEAALSSCKEGHIVQAGNPTHLEGPLYRACTTERNLWYVVEITSDPDDPNRSPRVDPQWAKDQINKYGRDNPWVLVNVFGKFPPSSFNALIGPEEVQEAVRRRYREPDFDKAPRILGIDVARYGDDSSIVFPRQGLQAFNPQQFRGVDGTEGASQVIRKWNEWDADAAFIDNTGGFGASWIDNLIRLGKAPIGIHFSQSSSSPQYFNKRAEMAFELVEWIKRGGAIPDIMELTRALTSTTYTFKGEKLIIEPKEDVKLKLGFSPDHMDSLMLTFAMPVEREPRDNFPINRNNHQVEYNPFSRAKALGLE